MTIEATNKIELKDVYVGEVWVCSGQSNMEWKLNWYKGEEPDSARAEPANPLIRFFTVDRNVQTAPVRDVRGSWVEANSKNVGNFSAVGYFFARDLQKRLK